jgi:galactokinase
MSGEVSWVDSLDEVYGDGTGVPENYRTRFEGLVKRFQDEYGQKPDFVSRSPGRVNIIGEHIDYSLYDVLPTAVINDVLIAVQVIEGGEPKFTIANINSSKYPTEETTIPKSGDVVIDKENHKWSNYFLAGVAGSLQTLRKQQGKDFVPKGLKLLVDGNVPAGGGLSSSAAFVCASALAVLAANGVKVSKQDLLDEAIISERSVGVYSGGMDQAASVFSERGYLLYCQFWPEFAAEHVPVPKANPDFAILVAQSFVTSDKAVTASQHYNLRVVEVTLASVVLAKLHDIALNPDHSSLGFSLRNFQEELMKRDGKSDLSMEQQVDAVIQVIKSKLDKENGYAREDIAEILEISVENLEKEYMSKFPVQADAFKLRQRALHVLEEARRVLLFRNTMSKSGTLDQSKLEYLGDLMNKTQESCAKVYECSCPEIDDICSIARRAGTYGSRLTGAGWGGCTVHLVPQKKVSTVVETLKKEYYNKHFPDLSEEKMAEAIVVTKPGQGSSVIHGKALSS